MKVTRIQIKDFNQFKDIDIDLTYPKGHEKAGQPLEKVCFIGQSGTGKTTLLNILGLYRNGKKINDLLFEKFLNNNSFSFSFRTQNNDWFSFTESLKKWDENPRFFLFKSDKSEFNNTELEIINQFEKNISLKLINFPADLKYKRKENSEKTDLSKEIVVDFDLDNVSDVWSMILMDVEKYQEDFFRIRQNIAKTVEETSDMSKIQNSLKELEEWKAREFNPIVDIADKCLDELLAPFQLRVKREFEFTKKEDFGFIKIEDFNGNEVPFDLWSTGTRQILYSALPLYLLKPENTIILFDEPERSLYPDMQRMIIDYYTSLTQDSQFFYATHSPIIASSFEPWEIVELKLDEKGNVYQDKYYEGERHVDNYTIFPQYLNYDLMLSNVFDLKETHNPIRNEKITEVLMLKNYLLKLKNEKKVDTPEFKDRYKEFKQLAVQLAWDFELF